MSSGRRPLLQEPAYRALAGPARAVLHGLWILASEAPDPGVLRRLCIGGQTTRGALADQLGLDSRTVAAAVAALVEGGWLRLAACADVADLDQNRHETVAVPNAGRSENATHPYDWHLPDAPLYQPAWVKSRERTRNWRNRQKQERLPLAGEAAPQPLDEPPAGRPADRGGGSDVTSPRRHGDSPPKERGRGIDPDHSLTPSRTRGGRDVTADGSQGAREHPWFCYRCKHRHAEHGAATTVAGACPKCKCARTGPFAMSSRNPDDPSYRPPRCEGCNSANLRRNGTWTTCLDCGRSPAIGGTDPPTFATSPP